MTLFQVVLIAAKAMDEEGSDDPSARPDGREAEEVREIGKREFVPPTRRVLCGAVICIHFAISWLDLATGCCCRPHTYQCVTSSAPSIFS